MIAWRRSQHLIFAGYSEAEILQFGNLAKLTDARMSELMHSNNPEAIKRISEQLNKKAPHIPAFSDNLVDKHVLMH